MTSENIGQLKKEMEYIEREIERERERGRLGVGVSSGVSQPLVLTPEKKGVARKAILRGAKIIKKEKKNQKVVSEIYAMTFHEN